MNITNMTRFGRSFSVIEIPYSLKLLIQELQTANIQMRIITEDNISQIENMSYSKNIEKLLMKPGATFVDVRASVNKTLGRDKGVLETPESMPSPESPDYPSTSPAYNPTTPESPQYPQTSPAYNPMTPESLSYEPSSPPYNPMAQESPPFNPTTPDESPPFNPTTPDESPPMSGGEREFDVGEIVYLRGGKKADTPYNVIKRGDKFLTIESMDPSNYEDDAIQVVLPFELFKQDEFNRAIQYDPFSKPLLQAPVRAISEQPGNGYPPGIVVAPVIKIVNGPDNSIHDEPENHSSEKDPFSVPVIRTLRGGNEAAAPLQIEKQQETHQPKAHDTAASSSGGGGFIDFAKNFIIKKMG
jgi:hypothetical protein